MSRLQLWELDHRENHEFDAILPRGWAIDGSRSVGGGSQTTISVELAIAQKPWLNLRRMVTSQHAKLGLWCGYTDTPWGAGLPVTVTLYNLPYVLSLRTPDSVETITGDTNYVMGQLIERINAQREMFLRLGKTSAATIFRAETIDQRPFWEQMNALAARAGRELFLRPDVSSGQLLIYVDILDRVGVDTGFLLHDGDGANIQVLNPTLDGKIINRLIGISSQNTSTSRLVTDPQLNQASINLYGMGSAVQQYQNVVDQTTLLTNTQLDLNYSSWPWLRIPIKILDVGRTLEQVRPGNSYILQTGNVYLPRGVQGYRGVAHLTALAYDETDETVGGLMDVQYAPR